MVPSEKRLQTQRFPYVLHISEGKEFKHLYKNTPTHQLLTVQVSFLITKFLFLPPPLWTHCPNILSSIPTTKHLSIFYFFYFCSMIFYTCALCKWPGTKEFYSFYFIIFKKEFFSPKCILQVVWCKEQNKNVL